MTSRDQVPRLYGMYQSNRSLRTFGEMLDNIFVPLFEVLAIPPRSPPARHPPRIQSCAA